MLHKLVGRIQRREGGVGSPFSTKNPVKTKDIMQIVTVSSCVVEYVYVHVCLFNA